MLYIVQLSLNNLSCAYASLVMLKSSFTDIMQEYKALCAEVSSADSTSWTHEHTLENFKEDMSSRYSIVRGAVRSRDHVQGNS